MSKFNLDKFNIKAGFDSEDVSFTMDCSERFQTTITFSLNTLFGAEGTENVKSYMQATNAVPFTQSLSEVFNVNALLDAFVIVSMDSKEELKTRVDVVKDTTFEVDAKEKIDLTLYLSTDIEFDVEASEKIQNNLNLVKNIITDELFLSESLQTVLRTSLLNLETLTLNVRLLPGGSIEIDSEMLSAYMGDTNVLDLYNGDWILIDKDTIGLEIGTGSGGKLEGVLVFKERFL